MEKPWAQQLADIADGVTEGADLFEQLCDLLERMDVDDLRELAANEGGPNLAAALIRHSRALERQAAASIRARAIMVRRLGPDRPKKGK